MKNPREHRNLQFFTFFVLLFFLFAYILVRAQDSTASIEDLTAEEMSEENIDTFEETEEDFWEEEEGFDDGAKLSFKGFVNNYQAVRLKKPFDFLSSRTRFYGVLEVKAENSALFTAIEGIYNNAIKSQTGVELCEAYFDYSTKFSDFRIGRQIIGWGKADGVQITDIISPLDLSEGVSDDYNDLMIAVDAVKARLLFQPVTLEVIWIPFFQPALLPSGDNPWAIEMAVSGDAPIMKEPVSPEFKLENSELAAKATLSFPSIDIGASIFRTWTDIPLLNQTSSTLGGTPTTIQGEYKRFTMVGLEFSRPIDAFVLRGEGAFYLGRHFDKTRLVVHRSLLIKDSSATMSLGAPVKKNSINWLLGIDWYPSASWIVTGQFVDETIFDYSKDIIQDENRATVTFSVSRTLMRETLSLSGFSALGINSRDGFISPVLKYSVNDQISLSAGASIFMDLDDKGTGAFAPYENNTNFWIKATYSF